MKLSRFIRIKNLTILCGLLRRISDYCPDAPELAGYAAALELRLSHYLETLKAQR